MQKKRRIYAIGGCALVLLAGAAFVIYWVLTPKMPSEKKMARLLADLYVVDAILQDRVNRNINDKTLEEAYHTVLAHYGMTKAEYDSALVWYSADTKKLISVYDRTIAILSARESAFSEIATKKDSAEKANTHLNDSITTRIGGKWPSSIRLPIKSSNKDTLSKYLKPSINDYNRIEFDFDLDSIVGGMITLNEKYTYSYKHAASKDSLAMLITVRYEDETQTSDTVRYVARKTVSQKEAGLTVELKEDVAATGVSVVPFMVNNMSEANVTLKDIKFYHKPYDVIDSTYHDFKLPSLFSY